VSVGGGSHLACASVTLATRGEYIRAFVNVSTVTAALGGTASLPEERHAPWEHIGAIVLSGRIRQPQPVDAERGHLIADDDPSKRSSERLIGRCR